MYVPAHFRLTDEATIDAFMQRELFGIIVTQGDDAPVATHLPMLYERNADGRATIMAHIARANPEWQTFESVKVLAIFQGPHAYISPSLYDGERNVPTWDYTAIHAYGKAHIVDDDAEAVSIVRRLTKRMEIERANPWNVETLSQDYLQTMVRGIVAFRIDVERIEAQFKLSQNRSQAERERIIAELSQSPDTTQRALARML